MEDLLDRVQRLKVKPDKELSEEVQSLRRLRDQIFDDLQTFVREREKHHWRIWDKYKSVGGKTTLKMSNKDLESTLQRITLEKAYLTNAVDRQSELERDFAGSKDIESNMLDYLKLINTDGWLELYNLSKLRQKQAA